MEKQLPPQGTTSLSDEVQMVPKKCRYCINTARYPRVPCVAKQLLRGRWRNNNTPMKYKCPNAQILEYPNTKGSNTKYPNNQILHTLYPRVPKCARKQLASQMEEQHLISNAQLKYK